MKRSLSILLFLTCSLLATSQDLFWEKSQLTNTSEKLQTIFSRSATRSVTPIVLDVEQLVKQQEITFSIEEDSYLLSPINIDVRGVNNFTITYRSSDSINSMVVSVYDKTIKGYLFLSQGIYSIETIDTDEYVLVSIDQSAFGEEINHDEYNVKNEINNDSATDSDETRMGDMHVWPVISVLVMYTNDVANSHSVSDIYTEIFNSESLTNLSFNNSALDCRIKVVYIGQTDYDEIAHTNTQCYEENWYRFLRPSDGYMDEVHNLRDQYAADICVLICKDDTSLYGVAQLNVDADSALCMVSYNGSTANFSFPHEIGHLIGCRHDMRASRDTIPYRYGHGYANPEKGWLTIMTTLYYCKQPPYYCNCSRIPFWSNPDVTYMGDPAGDEPFSNNARVWRERAETVSFFRTTDDDITITSPDVIDANYAHLFANGTLSTSGSNVTISSGNEVAFQAGNSISLQPGFHASSGSCFYAYISDYDSAATHYTVTPMALPPKFLTLGVKALSCKVIPNPVMDSSKILLSLDQDYTNLCIDVVDLLGRTVSNIAKEESIFQGEYSYTFAAESLYSGILFVVVSSNNMLLTSVKITKL